MRRIKVAVDCNMSRRAAGMLEALYGEQGYEFVMVADLVPPGTRDEHWADVFKRFGGQVVLSGDPRIGYRPHQARAFIANGFVSFFLAAPWSELPGHVKSAHLAYWWPAIHAKILEGPAGRNWRVPCAGKRAVLRLAPAALEPLVVPDDAPAVPMRARGRTAGGR